MNNNFESFLADIHGKQFVGTKDAIIEDYEQWLQDLSVEELIKYADRYAEERVKQTAAPELLEALTDLIEQVKGKQRKHDCPGFDCSICTPDFSKAEQAISKSEGKI